uniref:Uncharacterized protein n=1 Tax=Lactococcus garvieae TaxID=1363 RepID=G0X1V3_9LACT|nr:hypothetical protein [Lactococcus garvieae]
MEQHGISISDGQEGGYVLNFGKDYSNIVLWVFQRYLKLMTYGTRIRIT